MRTAALAYGIAILVVGLLVTLVMTRETETEKMEAAAKQEEAEKQPRALPAEITPGPEIAARVEEIRGQAFRGEAPAVQGVPEAELEKQLTALDAPPSSKKGLTAATGLLLAQAGALPAKQAETLAARRYGGTGVLGAYLPEQKTVLVSRELAEKEPEIAELVVAQE